MKRLISCVLIGATLASAAFAGSSSISWKKAYASATAEAKRTGKLMMIDFYTDWCGWCKKLDSDTYPAPEVVAQSEKFVPIKLNAEKDADGKRLAKKFAINGYPTILFLDGNEKLVYKVVGYEPAKDFAASMKTAGSIRQDKAKYTAALQSNPNDVSALLGMAGLEATMGNADAAAAHIAKAAPLVTSATKGKLLTAYNNLGDCYQNANEFDKAIPSFSKAMAPGYDSQTAYARISIAVCYASQGKTAQAKPYLEALVNMQNAPKEYLDQAKQMLAELSKQ